MKINIIAVGKKHDAKLVDAIAEYEKRLAGYCDLVWHIIPSSDVDQESRSILRKIQTDSIVVLLDERGKLWDNQQLAGYLDEAQNRSIKSISIVIGGAFGIDPSVIVRANAIVAFSPLVFPHQIVRLLLVEQLYRSYSILSGSKYHH